MSANKKILASPSKINWSAVDAAPMADVPDDDSSELTSEMFRQQRHINSYTENPWIFMLNR
jgi:hypothetical protein